MEGRLWLGLRDARDGGGGEGGLERGSFSRRRRGCRKISGLSIDTATETGVSSLVSPGSEPRRAGGGTGGGSSGGGDGSGKKEFEDRNGCGEANRSAGDHTSTVSKRALEIIMTWIEPSKKEKN